MNEREKLSNYRGWNELQNRSCTKHGANKEVNELAYICEKGDMKRSQKGGHWRGRGSDKDRNRSANQSDREKYTSEGKRRVSTTEGIGF